MNVNQNSLVLVLLSSHLGAPAGSSQEEKLHPLSLKEWNLIARKLQATGIKPSDLLAFSKTDLQGLFSIPEEEAVRLLALLSRREEIIGALERYEEIGIRVITRADMDYPQKFRQRLKESAPAVLFFAGNKDLLGQPGVCVVGSRHLDNIGQACAEFVGNSCGLSGMVLYSGGAKGVDTISMTSALESRGTAVGILVDSLERAVRKLDYRAALERGDLCLVTPYAPNAGFSVGAAMGRNRMIYTLSDYAIVVASDYEKGGTWAGATEALKNNWVPIFVLEHADMPEGNQQLLERGALAFPYPFQVHSSSLERWLKERGCEIGTPPTQLGLF